MSHDSITQRAEELGENFTSLLQPIEKAAESTCCSIRKEAEQMMSHANQKIRSNPLSAVVGGIAFGIAIGYIIKSCCQSSPRHPFDMREPLADAGDALSSSLRSAYKNVKFW